MSAPLLAQTDSIAPVSRKMIAVCDDNGPLVVLMKHLLNGKGFSVITAADGVEGMDVIRSERPDLLLLDLAMPGRDGVGLLEEMGKLEGKRPYTMVVTGQEAKSLRERATELGAQEIWKKPFNAAELLGRIDALVQQGLI